MAFEIEEKKLVRYTEEPGMTKIIIPKEVNALGKECFFNCQQIVSVILPDGLTEIPYRAFKNCRNLEKIQIPETVTRIEEAAFSGCERLRAFTLPPNLEKIDIYAFYGSERLLKFHFPEGTFRVQMNDIYQNQNDTALLKKFLCERNPEQKRILFRRISDTKYKAAIAYYLLHICQADDEIRKYSKRCATRVAKFRMDTQDTDGLKEVLESGFITKSNIQKLIDYAIQNQYHECYLLLLEYKDKHIGYQNPAAKLKL